LQLVTPLDDKKLPPVTSLDDKNAAPLDDRWVDSYRAFSPSALSANDRETLD
jgi:hypothetical protein